MFEAQLRGHAEPVRRIRLRELSGHEELVAVGNPALAATELLGRLLVGESGDPEPGKAWSLTLSERDQLVAALHAHCFGERVESNVQCPGCGATTNLEFSLPELVDDLFSRKDESIGVSGPDREGGYRLQDGRRFRLPTTADELAVSVLPPELAAGELANRCLDAEAARAEAPASTTATIERAMEVLGPVVDLQIRTPCAECGRELPVQFDVVRFFLASLEKERPILLREVHRLAAAYHWSRDDILSMPRSERRAHVALVEAERAIARRPG